MLSFYDRNSVELLVDAGNIPDLYWLEKFDRLMKILREEEKLKNPLLKSYKIFLAGAEVS